MREIESGASVTLPRVDLEDLLAALQVGPVDHDLAVEAAGAQQRGVEDLRPVGGGQEDDALLRVEAVHLGQELVERLLPLVVAAHHGADASRLSHGVQLVDEDDARRLGPAPARTGRARVRRRRRRTSRRSRSRSS